MEVNTETQTRFSAEIRIVPGWAWTLAAMAFIAAQIAVNIALAREPHAPPAWARLPFGVLLGLVAGAFLLLIGYINSDAKRRGMSRALWTIVAIMIPNALGIILYFILRQPLRSTCPQCGTIVQPGFNFCPRCSHKLSPSCPQCQRIVAVTDVYCPYCGTSLRNPEAPVGAPPTTLPNLG